MQVYIRTNYRIVKTTQDGETYYVPQYQEETDPNCTFHNFRNKLNGRVGGYNYIYFRNLEDAIQYVEDSIAIEDKVVWGKNSDNNPMD